MSARLEEREHGAIFLIVDRVTYALLDTATRKHARESILDPQNAAANYRSAMETLVGESIALEIMRRTKLGLTTGVLFEKAEQKTLS